jgi:hypothetical protein
LLFATFLITTTKASTNTTNFSQNKNSILTICVPNYNLRLPVSFALVDIERRNNERHLGNSEKERVKTLSIFEV